MMAVLMTLILMQLRRHSSLTQSRISWRTDSVGKATALDCNATTSTTSVGSRLTLVSEKSAASTCNNVVVTPSHPTITVASVVKLQATILLYHAASRAGTTPMIADALLRHVHRTMPAPPHLVRSEPFDSVLEDYV